MGDIVLGRELGGENTGGSSFVASDVRLGSSVVINCPSVFKDPGFRQWLNNGVPKMTWHRDGDPTEWSDVVVLVDPGLGGEGTDSDMPEEIWDWVVSQCRAHLAPKEGVPHIMVRLTNLVV